MIKVVSFDFYGVMYTNLDWSVINSRVYADPQKKADFAKLVTAANDGQIDNEEFRLRVARVADDDNHPDEKAVHVIPTVNKELMNYMRPLKDASDIKLAILSNGSKDHVCEVLESRDVLKEFDLIATSAELPNFKPEAAAFLYIPNYFGVEPNEVVHIDDSPKHVAGAKAAGIQALLYTDLSTLEDELGKLMPPVQNDQ